MRSDFTPEELALLALARHAAEQAYCPYSDFPVGAAVETDAGTFVGANMENASYGLAVCAERVALFSAIVAGATRIDRIALSCVAAKPEDPVGGRMPCGACRQVISEFMAPEATVVVDGAGSWLVAELLPDAFHFSPPPFLSERRRRTVTS